MRFSHVNMAFFSQHEIFEKNPLKPFYAQTFKSLKPFSASSRCSSVRATCGGSGSVSTRTRSSSARRSSGTALVAFPASWRTAASRRAPGARRRGARQGRRASRSSPAGARPAVPRRRACPRARWHPAARAARTARGAAARGKACAGLPGAGKPADCAAPPPARPQGCRMRTRAAADRGRAASVSCCSRRRPPGSSRG